MSKKKVDQLENVKENSPKRIQSEIESWQQNDSLFEQLPWFLIFDFLSGENIFALCIASKFLHDYAQSPKSINFWKSKIAILLDLNRIRKTCLDYPNSVWNQDWILLKSINEWTLVDFNELSQLMTWPKYKKHINKAKRQKILALTSNRTWFDAWRALDWMPQLFHEVVEFTSPLMHLAKGNARIYGGYSRFTPEEEIPVESTHGEEDLSEEELQRQYLADQLHGLLLITMIKEETKLDTIQQVISLLLNWNFTSSLLGKVSLMKYSERESVFDLQKIYLRYERIRGRAHMEMHCRYSPYEKTVCYSGNIFIIPNFEDFFPPSTNSAEEVESTPPNQAHVNLAIPQQIKLRDFVFRNVTNDEMTKHILSPNVMHPRIVDFCHQFDEFCQTWNQ